MMMKKQPHFNGFLTVGLLANAACLILNRFIEMPEFLAGFLQGLAIALLLFGAFTTTSAFQKMRGLKKKLLRG